MKLLIVDDEELTRTGVISSIDWTSLGIDEVLQADDGIHGLEAARLHKPEIILCDVRMPRMDGITMLECLESILPDTVAIFMSGYSDKEYLKAAIKLKAVSYIEKPLSPEAIKEAVLEARKLYTKKMNSRLGETLHSMETASRLALHLTASYGADSRHIDELAQKLSLNLTPGTWFTSFIVKFSASPELIMTSEGEIYRNFEEFLKPGCLECIHTWKRSQHLVFFVFGSSRMSDTTIGAIGNFLGRQFAPLGDYIIAAGDSCCGISRAYRSYAAAVVLLQNGFFFPAGAFLTTAMMEKHSSEHAAAPFPASPERFLGEALVSKDRRRCMEIQDELYTAFDKNQTLLPNQVKDLYYKLLLTLENVRKQLQIPDTAASEQESIVADVENCFTFRELHRTLQEKTENFFANAENTVQENPTIFMIRDYISRNYMNESLSVKDISSHVFLSASYVCTFFKNETGRTLNQYLTEYRMEKAKQLLSDPRYKISDISSRVGYSDGNYFGKSFKKYSGLSPSEYREKMTQ